MDEAMRRALAEAVLRRMEAVPLTDVPDFGLGPMTDATRAGVPNAEARQADPGLGERVMRHLLTYGPMPAKIATEVVKQPYYAGEAVGEAAYDPTLANVTNAGVQTALAVGQPLRALGVLGAGYGIAGARDAGANLFDEAEAGPRKKPAEIKVSELPGLTPEQQAEYADAVQRITRGQFASGAERRTLEGTRDRLANISAAFQTTEMGNEAKLKAEAAAKDREEYDRAVDKAETVRDDILKRDKRFADTDVAKIYDKTGGLTPALFGLGAGAVYRAATGPAETLAGRYLGPAISGSLAGFTAANAPLAFDAYTTPAANPEREAYQAYARELPPAHPRKKEFADYAQSLPEANPTRAAASAELYDPLRAGERALFGVLEGGGGAAIGAEVVQAMGRPVRAIGREARELLGSSRGGGGRSVPPPEPTGADLPSTGQTPPGVPDRVLPASKPRASYDPHRDLVRGVYRDIVEKESVIPPAREFNAGVQAEGARFPGGVPNITARTRQTNQAVEDFVKKNGRLPQSDEDWAQVFRATGTLGLAGLLGFDLAGEGEE